VRHFGRSLRPFRFRIDRKPARWTASVFRRHSEDQANGRESVACGSADSPSVRVREATYLADRVDRDLFLSSESGESLSYPATRSRAARRKRAGSRDRRESGGRERASGEKKAKAPKTTPRDTAARPRLCVIFQPAGKYCPTNQARLRNRWLVRELAGSRSRWNQ